MTDGPVDGFTVSRVGDRVILILTSRYGTGEQYEFDPEDAYRIGDALIECSLIKP
jgi:hypothetical protein